MLYNTGFLHPCYEQGHVPLITHPVRHPLSLFHRVIIITSRNIVLIRSASDIVVLLSKYNDEKHIQIPTERRSVIKNVYMYIYPEILDTIFKYMIIKNNNWSMLKSPGVSSWDVVLNSVNYSLLKPFGFAIFSYMYIER